MNKIRLDKALLKTISSRAKAQDMIKEGKISVNKKVITKASYLVSDEDDIVVTHTQDEFVSRGAFKLKGCLDKYNVDISNQVVLDIGASTGGFTDVCLRYGAKKVYALDVGHLQLAKELDQDCRVVKMEGHNAREIVPDWFDESIDFMCMDVSFISCKTILKHVLHVLSISHIAILVKPQFECGPAALNKHGVLKNSKLALQIVEDVKAFLFQYYKSVEAMPSILEGRSGNQEYMVYAKSLLIDAIGYLSGDRIKSNVIRNGKDKAILSMVLTSNEKVNSILEENGFEVDDQVIISRTILNNNKSTVRINQQITTLSFVRKIVNLLVDVHSQMDTYRLMDTKLQMELLDSYAKVEDLKSSVKEAYFSYSNVLNELETLKNEEFSDSELEFLTAQLDEIENANIQEDELESLNEQIHEASNWFKNKEDLSMCLYEMDKENGALDSLYTLYKQASKSSILNAYEETFKNLYYSLQSVDEELKHIRDTHSNDALDLDSLQNRQYLIKKLYRKYGGSYMSLMESKKNIMDKIDRIIHRQDVFDKLEKEKAESFAAYMKFAKELSLKRKAVFSELESKVMEHCKDLMLENARFKISCTEKKPSSNGIDEIEFLVSMNPGQDFSSLSVSASGGELSRLMLALKVVFQASNGIETIIFDEIDTGVSGKVALAMGAKMKALSNKYQVLCITHLASVAVMANTHYLVSKKSTFNETITRVQKLDHDQTIQELAIMTSGEASVKAKESMQDLWVKIHG